MTHNVRVESLGKCRRLFFDLTTGDVIGVASGGGAWQDFTGDDLIIATFSDMTAPSRIGCIEEYYNPLDRPGLTASPKKIDLNQVAEFQAAVDAHRQTKQALVLDSNDETKAACEAACDRCLTVRDSSVTYESLQN